MPHALLTCSLIKWPKHGLPCGWNLRTVGTVAGRHVSSLLLALSPHPTSQVPSCLHHGKTAAIGEIKGTKYNQHQKPLRRKRLVCLCMPRNLPKLTPLTWRRVKNVPIRLIPRAASMSDIRRCQLWSGGNLAVHCLVENRSIVSALILSHPPSFH